MVSEYGYITVADLEAYTGQDYSGINSKYTDTVLEAKISAAEELINAVIGTSYSGTIPDGIKVCTKLITSKLLYNQLLDDGYLDSTTRPRYSDPDILNPQIIQMLQPFISEYDDSEGVWFKND